MAGVDYAAQAFSLTTTIPPVLATVHAHPSARRNSRASATASDSRTHHAPPSSPYASAASPSRCASAIGVVVVTGGEAGAHSLQVQPSAVRDHPRARRRAAPVQATGRAHGPEQ